MQRVRLWPAKNPQNKKPIIWMGEMVLWGSGLISVKEKGRQPTTDSADRLRQGRQKQPIQVEICVIRRASSSLTHMKAL